MVKVFIDGREGTTGLRIASRLAARKDIELLEIDDAHRKSSDARRELINASDFTLLCLPDDGARESVSLCQNDRTVILDASTAHRISSGWVYGLPELSAKHRAAIASSKRIALPGCYASGFIMLTAPLVMGKMMPPDYPAVCHAVSGYSGAGKKGIAEYEALPHDALLSCPRQYALSMSHKHLPEMAVHAGLAYPPVFNPYICDYYAGMIVTVPLHARALSGSPSAKAVHELLSRCYDGQKLVRVLPFGGAEAAETGFLNAIPMAGKDFAEIIVSGNDERINLCARFDNLGKGASGAAVQCLNIAMGTDECTGLVL